MSSKQLIVKEIRERIAAGSLAQGSKLSSERALATEFGASRNAVQSALRDLEKQGFLMRRPNHRPIVLRSSAKSSIGVSRTADQIAIWILPDTQDVGGLMMLQGIRSVFGEVGYRMLIGCPPSYDKQVIDAAEVDFLRALVGNRDVAGAIVWDTGNLGCASVYKELANAKVPLVFIDREPSYEVGADVVTCNNRRAAQSAARHLIDLGHRRIGMVVGPDRASSVRDRIEGCRIALRRAELIQSEPWLYELHLDQTGDPLAEAEKLLAEILKSPHSPTALFAVNDRIALYLYEAAKSLRIEVPSRLSIVGFDWLLRWTPSGGEITTIAQPFEEIGRTAAKRVLDRIGSESSEPARHILLDAPLIVKDSTGAPFQDRLSSRISSQSSSSTGELIHVP